MRGFTTLATAAFLGSFAGAQAAQCAFPDPSFSCACTLATVETTAPVGALSGLVGDVQVTSQANFSPVRDPNPIFLGDSIIVPAGGQATLTIGGECAALLPENTSLVVRILDDCACAGSVDLDAGAGAGAGTTAALVTAAIVIGGGAAIIATMDDDDNDDPPSGGQASP